MKVRNYAITINLKILQIFSLKDLLFLIRQDNAQWYRYISHNAPCVPYKILHNHCIVFNLSWDHYNIQNKF